MQKVIWKYPLQITDVQTIRAAPGKVLAVQIQGEDLTLWIEVDLEHKELELRTFVIVGTGQTFQSDGLVHLGTAQMLGGQLVWHVYELFAL